MSRLDFSEFHPLDHAPWEPRCRGLPGSVRRHVELWWAYERPRPIQAVLCRLGRHDLTDFWEQGHTPDDPPDGVMCYRYDYTRKNR